MFQAVDPIALRINDDWRIDRLHVDGRPFVCPRVSTAQICGVLDSTPGNWEVITVQRYGSCYRVSDQPVSSRRRGGPRRVEWREVEAELRQLERSNMLPANKESCIFHLISFCEKELGRRVSRSSIQRNLKVQLGRLYD